MALERSPSEGDDGPVFVKFISIGLLFGLVLHNIIILQKLIEDFLLQKISQEDPIGHWDISGLINNCSQCYHAVR